MAKRRCFAHFDLQMCFSLRRRAIFRHRNVKKCSEPVSFFTFWLANVLLATAACNFSTSKLQKVVRTCCVLYILTWKCASRYSGVQFFHIPTSKNGPNMRCFEHFDLQMCFSLQQRLNFKKWSEHAVSKCASRYSGVQFFISPLNSYLRTRRFTKPTFRPSRPTNHWKTTAFRDFPNFSRICIFFLPIFAQLYLLSSDSTYSLLCFFIFWLCYSALLFQLSILSEVRLLNFLWWLVFMSITSSIYTDPKQKIWVQQKCDKLSTNSPIHQPNIPT